MANLYELMGDFESLQRAIDNDELTDAELDALLDELDDAKGTLKTKVDNIARLLSNLTSNITRFKAEEQRLAKRRKTMENKKERLRGWVRTSMDVLDVKSVKTDFHSVTISAASDTVIVTALGDVPEEYLHPPKDRTVDKKKVLKAYSDDGEIVKGCDIVKGDPSLTIR
jgi:ABC-type transporter Mla subunit MlaD